MRESARCHTLRVAQVGVRIAPSVCCAVAVLALAPVPASAISRCEVVARAQRWVDAAVPYSWDAWYTDPSNGACCYRTDCSGIVSAAWGLPPPGHTTYSLAGGLWDDGVSQVISGAELQPGDALNYPGDPSAQTGHVMLYISGDYDSGWVEVIEEFNFGEVAVHRWRSIDGSYLPIRFNGIEPCCTPATEQCNGRDDDCDGETDEERVCELAEEAVLQAASFDSGGSSDIDGDGLADVCGRAAAGVFCHLSTGASFGAQLTGPALADSAGWNDASNWSSLRLTDVTGDGRADLCGRGDGAFYCWPSTGTGFGEVIVGPALADASGWADWTNWVVLRMGDFNGDGRSDLCARGDAGIDCWLSTGSGFGAAIVGPRLADDHGWSDPSNFETIRVGDINGDGRADLCGRSDSGFDCWLSTGNGFGEPIAGPRLSDAASWNLGRYYTTLRLADFNGDGRDDLCGRGAAAFYCWPSTGDGFGEAVVGPALSDANGWGDYANFSTLRMGDINGDGKADLCGRAVGGFYCWPSTGIGFGEPIIGPALSDANGWGDATNYRTIRLADIDGDRRADICARSDARVQCWLSNGSGFPTDVFGPEWSDANGWNPWGYYATIAIAGPRPPPRCAPNPEECNGVDDDCDDIVDEGCAVDAGAHATDAGGEVVHDAGGEVVHDAGGEVVHDAGGEVVHDAGGEVVHDAGGEVVHDAGGEVVHDAGGEVVHDAGGEVIHDAGGEVIHDAGNQIAADGGSEAPPGEVTPGCSCSKHTAALRWSWLLLALIPAMWGRARRRRRGSGW